MIWTSAAPAIATAFLSSLVEAVEAMTIVLAVASVRGWRPAVMGALAGLAVLVVLVLALGPLLDQISLHLLQLVIGVLLLLFGMRWLRKAMLRAAGVIPLHDEAIAFATETKELREQTRHEARLNWVAGLASFKAVVLEGLEVVFIVIAVGAGRGLLGAASLGALAACLVVVVIGFLVHRPLAQGAREHAQVCRRSHAFSLRGILDWRGARRPVARRGLCYSSVCGPIPNGRAFRCHLYASP